MSERELTCEEKYETLRQKVLEVIAPFALAYLEAQDDKPQGDCMLLYNQIQWDYPHKLWIGGNYENDNYLRFSHLGALFDLFNRLEDEASKESESQS